MMPEYRDIVCAMTPKSNARCCREHVCPAPHRCSGVTVEKHPLLLLSFSILSFTAQLHSTNNIVPIPCSHLFQTIIVQLRGGERGAEVWTSHLKSFFSFFFSFEPQLPLPLFIWTTECSWINVFQATLKMSHLSLTANLVFTPVWHFPLPTSYFISTRLRWNKNTSESLVVSFQVENKDFKELKSMKVYGHFLYLGVPIV